MQPFGSQNNNWWTIIFWKMKEKNSLGIKRAFAFFFFPIQGWSCRLSQTFSRDRYAHAYCFGPQSITSAWGKCQECFLCTGRGFYLCAPLSDNITAIADLWRAQQGFFFQQHSKKNLPLEEKRCILFVPLFNFFFSSKGDTPIWRTGKKKKKKRKGRNRGTHKPRWVSTLLLFAAY